MPVAITLHAPDGLALNLVDFGGAGVPPLLLVHGSFGHARVWDAVVEHLPASMHAFALDLPGHGDSGHAADAARYGFDALVEDVGTAVTALPAPPVLAGHSIGAAVAMLYAARRAATLAGAVFIDIDPCPPDYQVQHLNEAGSRPAKRYTSFEDAVAREARIAPGATAAMHDHLARHGYREAGGSWEQKYDQGFLRAIRRWDVLDALREVRVPALIIRGGDSAVMAPESPARMLERLPAGSAITIPAAGHQVHLERPAEVAAALARFVATLRPGA